MKTSNMLICIYILFSLNTNAQISYTSEKDVFNTKKVIFYGFDFKEFQLFDIKRIGQDLKKYVFNLNGFLIDHLSEKKLGKWLKKDTIIYNLNPTMTINKKINNEDIASTSKHIINKDSLQTYINRYSITEKEGIGYVIIFECFDNSAKTISAYSVFFNISTKNILSVDYICERDNNSYNRLTDWSAAAFVSVKKITSKYKGKEKIYKKPVK